MARRILAAVALLAVAAVAWADYKQSYRDGIEAIEKKKDWAAARNAMQQAIAENPTAGGRVKLYGMVFRDYTPHYYLGLALYNLGDCPGALREWQTAANQGVADMSGVQGYRSQCQQSARPTPAPRPTATPRPSATPTSLPRTSPTPVGPDPAVMLAAIRSAETEIGKAETAEGMVTRLRADRALADAWAKESELVHDLDQASRSLEQARAKLRSGKSGQKLADVEEASRLAAQARTTLEAIPQRLDAVRAELEKRPTPTPLRATPTRPLPTATRPPLPTPTPRGPTPTPLPASGVEVPAPLVNAVQAYLGGNYQGTIDLLVDQNFADRRVSAVAYLLRAASRYLLYRAGGSSDEALRQEAEADVRSTKRLDSTVVPDPDSFSPSFIEFFDKTR